MTTRVISIREKGEAYAVDGDGGGTGATHVHNHGTRHTPGPSAKAVSKWAIGVCSFIALISLGALIVGALIPSIVDNIITEGVKDYTVLDVKRMDADALERFVNSSTHLDYSLWHFSNLKDVLLNGAVPNFEERGPFKTIRYQTKYNLSYNEDRSVVSYKQYVSFEIDMTDDYTRMHIDEPIVGPNPLYFGAGAQVMMLAQAAASGGKMSPRFWLTGPNELSDQLTTFGFMGTSVLKGVFEQFTDPSSMLLGQIAFASFPSYLQYVAVAGPSFLGGQSVISFWADGDNSTAVNAVAFGAGFPYDECFIGFDLGDRKLLSSNKVAVSAYLWNPASEYSLLSSGGLLKWLDYIGKMAASFIDPAGELAARQAVATKIGADNNLDVKGIAGWIMSLMPQSMSGVYNSLHVPAAARGFEVAVVAGGMKSIIQQMVSDFPSRTFAAVFSDSNYYPESMVDAGALQFATGFVVGISFADTPLSFNNLSWTGVGESMRHPAIGGTTVTGPTAVLNFFDLATPTWGGVEPPEFFAGVKYYLENVAASASVDEGFGLVYGTSPQLLYVDDSNNPGQTTTVITPTIAEAKLLMAALSSAQGMGGLFAGLNFLVGAYGEAFMGNLGAGPAGAATIARGTVAGVLANSTLAGSGKAYVDAAIASGVTARTWFVTYTYMLYLINELNGPLSLIGADGIAPQNGGMFSKKSARDILFGYVARFTEVPGLAGPLVDWPNLQANIDKDYKGKIGRDIAQYTGEHDLEKTGLFQKYNGYKQYQTYCDLLDPGKAGIGEVSGVPVDCVSPAGRAVWNDEIFLAPEVVDGNGDGMSQAPFKEGDDKRPAGYTLYIDEAKRVLPLVYDADTRVKDIDLRRYIVNLECLIGDNYWRNATRMRVEHPEQVPNGFTSAQSVLDGLPVVLGLPHHGPPVDAGFTGGVTCTGSDGQPGHNCSTTWDFEKHGTYVAVEPITGLTMDGHKRLQANLRITKHEYYTDLTSSDQGVAGTYNNLFAHADQLIIPWYWVDLNDRIKDDLASDFRDSRDTIYSGRDLADALHIAGLSLGSVGVVASIGTMVWLFQRK